MRQPAAENLSALKRHPGKPLETKAHKKSLLGFPKRLFKKVLYSLIVSRTRSRDGVPSQRDKEHLQALVHG